MCCISRKSVLFTNVTQWVHRPFTAVTVQSLVFFAEQCKGGYSKTVTEMLIMRLIKKCVSSCGLGTEGVCITGTVIRNIPNHQLLVIKWIALSLPWSWAECARAVSDTDLARTVRGRMRFHSRAYQFTFKTGQCENVLQSRLWVRVRGVRAVVKKKKGRPLWVRIESILRVQVKSARLRGGL